MWARTCARYCARLRPTCSACASSFAMTSFGRRRRTSRTPRSRSRCRDRRFATALRCSDRSPMSILVPLQESLPSLVSRSPERLASARPSLSALCFLRGFMLFTWLRDHDAEPLAPSGRSREPLPGAEEDRAGARGPWDDVRAHVYRPLREAGAETLGSASAITVGWPPERSWH